MEDKCMFIKFVVIHISSTLNLLSFNVNSLLFMSLSVVYALIALIYHPTTIYVINQNSDYLF